MKPWRMAGENGYLNGVIVWQPMAAILPVINLKMRQLGQSGVMRSWRNLVRKHPYSTAAWRQRKSMASSGFSMLMAVASQLAGG